MNIIKKRIAIKIERGMYISLNNMWDYKEDEGLRKEKD